MTANHTVRLHSRDLQLLLSLEEGRVCTARQAARYLWGHINSANRRLKELEAAGLIHRVIDRCLRETFIRPTPAGIQVLLDRGQVAPEEMTWPPRLRQQTIRHLVHETEVNELRFRLEEACHHHPGVLLISCRSGPKLFDQVQGNGSNHTIRPDRELELSVSVNGRAQVLKAFLEHDRGTRPIKVRSRDRKDIVRQLSAYDLFPPDRALLVTTPSLNRIAAIVEGMLRYAKRHGGEVGMRRYYTPFSEVIQDPLAGIWLPEQPLAKALGWLLNLPIDQVLGEALAAYPDVRSRLDGRQLSSPYRRSRRQGPPWCDPALRDAVLDALLLANRLKRHSLLELPGLLPA